MDIAVDGGFGYFKFFNKDNKMVVRSVYRKVGNEYEVGDKVLGGINPRYLRTVEDLREMYPHFIRNVIKGERISRLAVGLPLDAYNRGVNMLRAGKQSDISVLTNVLGLLADDIKVFPQGLGLIKAYLKEQEVKDGNVLAIDIGFNTVIVVLYDIRNKEIIFSKTYYRHGISQMVSNLEEEIATDRTYTPIEIDYIMRVGVVNIGFDMVDISEIRERATNEYISDLLRIIVGDIKTTMGVAAFDTVLFGGGGAAYFGNIKSNKTKIIVIDDPQFANARGFYYKLVGEQ